ncbi:DNA-binding MarR family transcriptional regulator [Jatrophihabitans sp. GAS493]|uniref:MarR family winged helix-turn-helix transcriptional regulator n=1 Tax=Jatrophihabitans sp. GAS493 TaxID=1907575 RepID=UPI000BB9A2BE|nr:MarR family transcriptional regulator [Jatrophihabitans sp. GAS493]SOD73623.1 DNA-binding MarR family transcriptional regulator [Jatrophihabitans sp. GAS493]
MAPREVSSIEVGQTYLELHHQLHRHVDQVMSAAGLSLARAKVLMRLSEGGPMNQAKLAGILGFAPRSVTDTVDALERDGLVTRTEDERDRRARIVSVTPAGSDALEAALLVRSKVMDEIFGSLPAADRAVLVDLLRTVKTNFPSGENSCAQ